MQAAQTIPVTTSKSSEPVWRTAILTGPYLNKTLCKLQFDQSGRILDCDKIHCVFSGEPQFDGWFRSLYGPVVFRP